MLRRRREMRAAGKTVIIPEDDPNQYKQALHKRAVKVSPSKKFAFSQKFPQSLKRKNCFTLLLHFIFKLFADLERLRIEIADREADMRRNVAESEEADKKKAEREKEFKKNFEATRQKRTDVS